MLQTQRSKSDADRLVESLKRKGNSGQELQLKGFHVASLYFQAREYATALSYCQNYVSAKPNDARAHKLLGQINEALQNVPKAIEGYRRALELNEMQKDLILKVAELYCKIRCEPERHRYWAERAEKYYPGHEIVHKIREHIFRASGKLNELEQYLRTKLRNYPNDANLHVQLLRVLVELGRLKEAKQLCVKVETSHMFDSYQGWWEQAISVYLQMLTHWGRDQSHHAQVACITTYCNLLYAINRLIVLSLANHALSTAQTAEILKRLDHDLVKASDCVASSQFSSEVPHAQATLEEMKAQMYYHVGTLLMKMAANNQVRWNDVIGMATVSYLVSLQVVPDERNRESKNESLANLYKMACSRLSEISHVLDGLVKQHGTPWLEECVEQWCNEEGRQQFLYQVFGEDSGVTDLSSLHVDDSYLLTNTPELPDLVETVFNYDQDSILYEPSDPHRLVWLGLQWDIRQDHILPDLGNFVESIFSRLVFSTNNLDNISVDNIRLLDIEAFLYASAHVASTALSQLSQRDLINKDLPIQRPLVLHRGLCSEEQKEWYTALYQLYTGKAKSSDRAKLRLTAQKGLEVLRCRINHGMDTALLVQLGKTFHARMKEVQNQSDDPHTKRDQWTAYQRMSVMYWQSALEQLRLLQSGKAVPQQKKPFFPYQPKQLQANQVHEYLDEGSVVVSEFKFQLGKHQEALDCINNAKTPDALYTKAMMYKTLAGMETDGQPEEDLNTSQLSKQGELLDKAKCALFATMDSIEDKPNHNLHGPVNEMLEEIESDQTHLARELSHMDAPHDSSRLSGVGDFANRSHVARPTFEDDEEHSKDPSPRRLAAEMRAMNTSHTRLIEENSTLREIQSSHNRILEQNQALMERQNELLESNNSLMKQIVEMNIKFQDLSTKLTEQQQAAANKPPTPAPQQDAAAAAINANKPIVISAQMCKIESPNVAGAMPYAASPVHAGLQGMYPYQQPHPAYYSPHHQYPYTYDSVLQMAAGTPTGRRTQAMYTGYEDIGAESDMAANMMGRNLSQVVPPSVQLGNHQGLYNGSPLANLVSQATQLQNQQQQQQSPKTILVQDQNGTTRIAQVPDVASRPGATPSYFANPDASSLSPAAAQQPSDRNVLSAVSPSGASKNASPGSAKVAEQSPLLMSMLQGDKNKGIASGSSVIGQAAVSPQQGSIASGLPVRPQTQVSKPAAPAQASFTFKPQQQGFSFGLQTQSTAAANSSSGFQFVAPSQPTAAKTAALNQFTFKPTAPVTTPSSSFASTPPSNPFAQPKPATSFGDFSFASSSPVGTTPASSVQKAAAPSVFGQPSKQPDLGQSSLGSTSSFVVPTTPTAPVADEDLVFVSEKLPSETLQAKAKSLKLPIAFYNYLDAPPCKGCIGCHDEDYDSIDELIWGRKPGASREEDTFGAEAAKAPSSTSGFGSFGGLAAMSSNSSESSKAGDIFGAASTGIDFASLASTSSSSGFADNKSKIGFANAGAQLFGTGGDGTEADGGTHQEYDPQYEAIVSLPTNFEQKTGHEEEEEQYKQRCRLYRFDSEKNQWKERGVGDVKLMRHKASGRVRVVMRRDQVHKVCANHIITPGMELKAMGTSDRAWVYNAIDFSEGESSPELLAIKFKNPEIAQDFKAKFEECQADIAEGRMGGEVAKPLDNQQTNQPSASAGGALKKPEEDIMAKFQLKEGDWECDGCCCRNNASVTVCPACATPKPGSGPPKSASAAQFSFKPTTSSAGAFAQNAPAADANLLAKFKAKEGEWDCDGCCCRNDASMIVCPACGTRKPGSEQAPSEIKPSAPSGGTMTAGGFKPSASMMSSGGFAFGTSQQTSTPATETKSAFGFQPLGSGFSFGTPATDQPTSGAGFSFGSPANEPKAQATSGTGFAFGSPAPQPQAQPTSGTGFSFGAPVTPPKAQATQSAGFSFGQAVTPAKQSAPSQEDTTPGGTPTTRFSFDSGDSRNTGLPQFSFGEVKKDTEPTGTSFAFGNMSSIRASPDQAADQSSQDQTVPTQYPFAQALQTISKNASTPKSPTSSFNDMAKSQEGPVFSFRMDVSSISTKPSPPKTVKSPGLLRSPGIARSPGGDGEYYTNEEGDDIYFDPIVQLPENVDLKTGEEDESAVFTHRCKLYRYDGETSAWKERGLGDIKILYNNTTGKYRIVMRRDQVHKVCANHFLTETMTLSPNAGSDRSLVWQAMDAADGEAQMEQLAVKFKAADTAAKFKDIFEAAVEELQKKDSISRESSSSGPVTTESKSDVTEESSTPEVSDVQSSEVSSSSEPKKELKHANVETALSEIFKDSPKPPTSAVSGDAEHNPEAERDIHFDPIANLPEKVDLQTGEESEETLFCSRSKLYRFDTESKAWKDRGVGDVKILHNKESERFRVIMRREQVLKVCANHYITAEMKLTPNAQSKTSWVWQAMDAAEGEPKFEQLAIKFKHEETAVKFKGVFEECQKKLQDEDGDETGGNEDVIDKEENTSNTQATPGSVGSDNTSSPSTSKGSTIGGGPVASPSDAPGSVVTSTLSAASPDLIPKSKSSPELHIGPSSAKGGLMSLLKDGPFDILGARDKGESSSETTTGTTSDSQPTSDNEEDDGEEEYEEDEVGESNV